MTTVDSPDGAHWKVRIAWMPRWRALARRYGGWRAKRRPDQRRSGSRGGGNLSDVGNLDPGGHRGGGWGDLGDDIFIAILVILGMIAFGLIFWWVLLPLLLVVLDGLIVAALVIVAVPARVLFRRPWTIEARSDDRVITREVIGWQRAREARDELAEQIRLGVVRPDPQIVAG